MRRTILLLSLFALLLASCGSETDEGQDAQPTAPAASSGSAEPSPSGSTASLPVGTWKGDVAWPASSMEWSAKVTILPCVPGDRCGQMEWASRNAKGEKVSCGGTLTYEGRSDNAFIFSERFEYSRGDFQSTGGDWCGNAQLYVTPFASGRTVGIEEKRLAGVWFGDYGALRLVE